jgi:TRAP-type C4-dicarboxylate transport system permease small subunit
LYSTTAIWIHIIATILALTLIGIMLFFGESLINPKPRSYYDISNWNSSGINSTNSKIISVSIVVLLFVQIIFVLNFIAGLFISKTQELPKPYKK